MFVSSVIMMLAGLPKSKKVSLALQTVQVFGMAVSNIFFGSLPGCFTNIFSGLRNILIYKEKLKLPYKLLLSLITIVISVVFNNVGIFVLFPILSFAIFTLWGDVKNVVHFKIIVILSNFMWLVHDLAVMSYVGVAFNIFGTITNLIGIYRLKADSRPSSNKSQK